MTGTTLRHPGDPLPALGVNLPGGRTLHLPDDLAGRFGVVLFCQGARFPYGNAQLSAFQRAENPAHLRTELLFMPESMT